MINCKKGEEESKRSALSPAYLLTYVYLERGMKRACMHILKYRRSRKTEVHLDFPYMECKDRGIRINQLMYVSGENTDWVRISHELSLAMAIAMIRYVSRLLVSRQVFNKRGTQFRHHRSQSPLPEWAIWSMQYVYNNGAPKFETKRRRSCMY